ncbi:tyrosine-type recombinase/integrase [Nonomuraea sp. NPDC048916]|uniref:tyrosine-type recombinase/integrase n=1 Tax=Nonomuraea sp. NPDC048916 TaxID=3154232 RepID=UPI0033C039A6
MRSASAASRGDATSDLITDSQGPGREALPRIRVHDLRHTHATILLMGGKPVKVVSERLGHADPAITLRVYAHVMPGNQREAADWFAALVESA